MVKYWRCYNCNNKTRYVPTFIYFPVAVKGQNNEDSSQAQNDTKDSSQA